LLRGKVLNGVMQVRWSPKRDSAAPFRYGLGSSGGGRRLSRKAAEVCCYRVGALVGRRASFGDPGAEGSAGERALELVLGGTIVLRRPSGSSSSGPRRDLARHHDKMASAAVRRARRSAGCRHRRRSSRTNFSRTQGRTLPWGLATDQGRRARAILEAGFRVRGLWGGAGKTIGASGT